MITHVRKLSIGLSLAAFVVLVFMGSTYVAIAQDTNTGGPASLAPGGLVPFDSGIAHETNTGGPASPGIAFDLSPGTGAPPATLGGYTMTPVPYPGAPACTGVTPPLPVPGGGGIDITPWDARCIGSGWMTWSHGYVGDVYYTGGPTSQTLTLPAGTKAVYFYVEPNPFAVHSFEAIAQPGSVSTGSFTADGSYGATYVGFYATGGDTIQSITINCAVDFAVGEFGWAGGAAPGDCFYDLSPGTGAPPATLGGFTMTPVPYPGAPACTGILPPLPVPGGGEIGIAPVYASSLCVGSGWATWSHGYTGDVYFSGYGVTSQTLTFPAGTKAAYFYVEPNPMAVHTFVATAQPCGVSTEPFTADGSYGATYVGFYATDSSTIESITITCTSGVDFAVGEFGWAGGVGPGDCFYDLSPGTGAPPATLGGYTMTPVPYPGAPACTGVTPPLPVPGGGGIDITPCYATCIGIGWATWSHGYAGDVYPTGGATSQTLTFPAGTKAAYFYVEPNPFAVHTFVATAQPCGVSTVPFTADGSYGATYVGFYATDSSTIESITITCITDVDFAIGEFGWAGGGGPGPGECVEDDSGKLDIAGSSGGPGGTTAVRARIQGAPNPVGALGFEVVFDPTLMTYTGFERGALVADFDFFECNIPAGEDSIVRCGGFKSTGGIAAGASGDVVILDFDVMQCVQGDTYPLDLQELKDDIGSWSSSHGCFQCGCSCDINGDGEITPQDALCAFQVYLGICPTACGPCDEICCDVTMDDDCTPQDALEIFKEYLGLESVCTQPVAPECTPPPYNPEKWNDGGSIQHNNNCYNYANDEITMTFAQPGRACGDYPNPMECGEVYNAAACDGLVPSTKTAACPDDMHKVYLVVAPGYDYHWYRQDIPDGMWSHKPGSTPATDRDGYGQPISDPETAYTGGYTSHCGYMCACGDNADIQ